MKENKKIDVESEIVKNKKEKWEEKINGILYKVKKNDHFDGFDGTAKVIGLTGKLSTVNIPSTIESKKKYGKYLVTKIGSAAFNFGANVVHVEAIRIPNSVTKIKRQAFCGCHNLKYIEISDDVKDLHIGSQAFLFCSDIEPIVIPDGVVSIEDDAFPPKTTLLGKSDYFKLFAKVNSELYNFVWNEGN